MKTSLLVLMMLAPGAQAAQLSVSIADGDPYDHIRIAQHGDCNGVTGRLTVDFSTSRGDVVLDTVRGGPGTKDPMDVAVEAGPLLLAPVEDGAQQLLISILALPTGQIASVTMDFDDQKGWWPVPRVVADGDDLAGTRVVFETLGFGTEAVLGRSGVVTLDLPEDACGAPGPDAPLSHVPMG